MTPGTFPPHANEFLSTIRKGPHMTTTMRFLTHGFLAAILVLGVGCKRSSSGDATSIQVKGSDTMVNLGQAWAEEFMKSNPGSSVAVTGGGSGTGISSMISNTCDIAEVSREMKESELAMAREKGIDPIEFKVALDGLAVVVHPSNAVEKLTLEQLAGIFTGSIKNWRQVGGHDKPIVILSREVNSGTHVYFKEHVLRKGDPKGTEEFAPEALLLPSSQALADEVAQNPDAIGYLGMGYISAKEKTILVAKSDKDPHVAPTMENVISNAYPISRPLLMYTKGQPAGLVKQFMDFVLSPQGQEVVRRLDFVPVK